MSKILLDGHKLACHKDRVKAWMRGERVAPISIDWALTRKCPLNCIYCYSKLQDNEDRHITRSSALRFLDDCKDIGVKSTILMSDGESTISPHFYDVVKHSYDLGLDMGLATYGGHLREDKLLDVLQSLKYIRFNISAATPDDYLRIHGAPLFNKVCGVIKRCVELKKEHNLDITLGTQIVLMPQLQDQVIPLTKLSKDFGVDYFVIKHCSDDGFHTLGINYADYTKELMDIVKKAESYSNKNFQVAAKWSKITSGEKRNYTRCLGTPLLTQISGSGLLAPCGMLFNNRYKRFHIGNINDNSFKQLWKSDKYWGIMNYLASGKFNPGKECGYLCIQNNINETLSELRNGDICIDDFNISDDMKLHRNFL